MEIRKIWREAAATLFAATILSGCHTPAEAPLVQSVPADAVVIKAINITELLKEASVPDPFSGADTLTAEAQAVTDLCVEPDFHEAFASVLKARDYADLSQVLMFTASDGNQLILFPLHSPDAFINTIDNGEGAESHAGFLTLRSGGMLFAVKDNRCWIARDMADINAAVRSAAGSHIGTLPGIRDFISSDAAAAVAVNCGNSTLSFLGGKDRWLCVSFQTSELAVSARATVMDRDGRLDSIGNSFQQIDTDFLRYTPSDAAVVLAFGKFSGNVRALSFLLGRFAPVYLQDASGTTSLYAVPAGRAEAVASHAPGSWNVETMIKVPESVLQQGLLEYQTGSGHPVRKIGDQWTYGTGEESYYFGAFDGALVFSSNREISADYNNSFTEDFLGKRAAMVVNIPSGSVLCQAWRLPCGLTFKTSLQATQWNARITFHGSRLPAFATLLKLPQLADYSERFASAISL